MTSKLPDAAPAPQTPISSSRRQNDVKTEKMTPQSPPDLGALYKEVKSMEKAKGKGKGSPQKPSISSTGNTKSTDITNKTQRSELLSLARPDTSSKQLPSSSKKQPTFGTLTTSNQPSASATANSPPRLRRTNFLQPQSQDRDWSVSSSPGTSEIPAVTLPKKLAPPTKDLPISAKKMPDPQQNLPEPSDKTLPPPKTISAPSAAKEKKARDLDAFEADKGGDKGQESEEKQPARKRARKRDSSVVKVEESNLGEEPKAADLEHEAKDEDSVTPIHIGVLEVGCSIYDENVAVYASLTAASVLTFKVDEGQAKDSDHEYSGRITANFKYIKFKEVWARLGSEEKMKRAIKEKLNGMLGAKESSLKICLSEPDGGSAPASKQPPAIEPNTTIPNLALKALESVRDTLIEQGKAFRIHESQLTERNATITKQNIRIEKLEATIKDQNTELRQQKEAIQKKEDALKELREVSQESIGASNQLHNSTAENANLELEIKKLKQQIASLSKGKAATVTPTASGSQAPTKSSQSTAAVKETQVHELKLKGKTFAETFLKIGDGDPNAGKYIERNAGHRTTPEGRQYMVTRILQDVDLAVTGELMKGEEHALNATFLRYVLDGKVKLVQKFGADCLMKSEGREFLCRHELVELVDENEDHEESLL